MHSTTLWPWAALLLLGVAHGVNPGMGWLFAVALGLQQQDRRAVWRALLPLAMGHMLAIAAAVGLAAAAGVVLAPAQLRWLVAAALLAMGVFHLVRHRHFNWGGMRVGARDLTIWSFLMASAHGAGLMALPVVLVAGHGGHAAGGHLAHATGMLASGVHTAGYLLTTGVIAVVVYERLGLRLLRSAWLNIDVLWAGALVLAAVVTL